MNSKSVHSINSRPLKSRLYQSEHDLLKMQGLLMEGRSQTDDWHYVHIGDLVFRFLMVTCHLNPQECIRLWHGDKGRLVGYAILGEDPSFECQVLPEFEWSGIETEALAWVEARLIELRKLDAKQWSGMLVSTCRENDPKRLAFLKQHGFRYSGEFAEVNMLRSLDEPIPEPIVPAGFKVRALAEAGETSNRAAAHCEVWQPWTDGNVSDEDYVRFMNLPGYDRDLDIVAVTPEGIIASFVNGWTDPINRIGDLGPVGALPAYRRQGLTRAALLEGMRRLKAHGMERVCISTGVANTAARNLYESIGFKIVNKTLDYGKP